MYLVLGTWCNLTSDEVTKVKMGGSSALRLRLLGLSRSLTDQATKAVLTAYVFSNKAESSGEEMTINFIHTKLRQAYSVPSVPAWTKCHLRFLDNSTAGYVAHRLHHRAPPCDDSKPSNKNTARPHFIDPGNHRSSTHDVAA